MRTKVKNKYGTFFGSRLFKTQTAKINQNNNVKLLFIVNNKQGT